MIGNTIKFRDTSSRWVGNSYIQLKDCPIMEGLVVDAYTEITGRSEGAFGFSEGKTCSDRKYKVQYNYCDTGTKFFMDIYASQLTEIVKFANTPNQEINEEKIVNT